MGRKAGCIWATVVLLWLLGAREMPTVEALPTTEPEPLTVQVTGAVVNLRSGPSLQHEVLAQVPAGDELPVTGISADRQWLHVEPGGSGRWIYADLTDVTPALRRQLAVETVLYLTDREVLGALWAATEGSRWVAGHGTNWLSEGPLDTWQGVTTNAAGRVVGLDLAEAGLRGPLPAVVSRMTALESLDLSHNRLYGPVPQTLGQLPQLSVLYLGDNAWTGCLPQVWRRLSPLQSDGHRLFLTGDSPPDRMGSGWGRLSLPYCDDEASGAFDDGATHREGGWRLQRWDPQWPEEGILVRATLGSTRAPLPVGQDRFVLFTLPPGYRPSEPYTRLVWGHAVPAAGKPWPRGVLRPRGRLQVGTDGAVQLVATAEEVEAGYWG